MLQSHQFTCWLVVLVVAILASRLTHAQEAAAPATRRAMSVEDERKARAAAKAAAATAAEEQGKKPDGDQKPADDADKKSDGDKKDEEKESGLPIITRPDKYDGPSTADRMHEQIGADGRVQFNLQGVPWPALLKWLADVSQLSLDWQELPGDYLNLRTQHSYTVEEARDVINRHLLARGFTMLKRGELLKVANVKKINQGFVPRVTPQGLDDRMPHEFVKVSFPLDWMLAADAVEELKPMLSPNGTLTALTSTNRLEAMDAVVNLREIRTLLAEEQTGSGGQESLVKVFRLVHVRARDILPLLQEMVGLENHGSVTGNVSDSSARQILQQMQQLQQLVQRNANNANKGGGGKATDDSKPKLIVNERDNSILVHAAPDKMEIIKQAIEALDTPSRREAHLLQNLSRFKVHRLSTLDPTPLVSILTELGDLSPTTKIEVDETNKSLIVYGSLTDQVTVKTLVDKLDGSSRSFEVVQLRRLRAEDVAGTIMYMLGEEEEDSSRNSRYSYNYYYDSRSSNYRSKSQDDKRPFRIDADIDNNRLLLWANELEREEVETLLVKMGEIPSGTRSNETMRFIDLSSDRDAEEMLERIRRLWPNIAPNKLEIGPRPQTRKDDSDFSTQEPAAATQPATRSATVSDSTADLRSTLIDVRDDDGAVLLSRSDVGQDWREFVGQYEASSAIAQATGTAANEHRPDESRQPGDELVADDSTPPPDLGTSPTNVRPEDSPPPVIIQRGPNGRLILGSPDTEALNQLEDLLAEFAPKRRDYEIFKLKHPGTYVFDVEYNLNAFFKQEEDGQNSGYYDYYYGYYNEKKSDDGSRLSRRKPLKIIGDVVSRTILVQGASPDQLRTIAELIEIYDQPEADNPQMIRKTRLFTVKYSDAYVVAEAIKNAYRDLLSPNDPAFEKKNAEEARARSNDMTIKYDYASRYGNDEDDAPNRPEPIRFKGALSMGVDEISNTIIVSAAVGLLNEIEHQIKDLDELAKAANNIRVVPVSRAINLSALKERMSTVLQVSRPSQNGFNGQQAQAPPANGIDPRNNFNNGQNLAR